MKKINVITDEVLDELTRRVIAKEMPSADLAADSSTASHFCQDDYFLSLVIDGQLTEAEHQAVLAHLAICSPCRRTLGELIELRLSEVAGFRERWIVNVLSRRVGPGLVALAAAACLLVGIIWIWSYSPEWGSSRLLAQAKIAVESSRYEEALRLLEELKRTQGGAVSPEGCQLLEEAAYGWAREGLRVGDFRRVFAAEEKIQQCPGPSARLRNLALQAQQGLRSEIALDEGGTLLHFGYEPDGRSYMKAVMLGPEPIEPGAASPSAPSHPAAPAPPTAAPSEGVASPPASVDNGPGEARSPEPRSPLPPGQDQAGRQQQAKPEMIPQGGAPPFPMGLTTARLLEEYRQSIKEFPHDVNLLLNYGYLRFKIGDFEQARKCFEQVLSTAPGNARALVGLGLVAFDSCDTEQATRYFEDALASAPDYLPAKINLAICYEALGRKLEARKLWSAIPYSELPAGIRAQIELHLERSTQNN
ncbi:MAG: tetratricopeptide repeat protein [Thermoguttaceae bacterium]|nr:tetratricopeptide repeat protein [Thermoguttaceae bacterium]MDW8079804.1 tetratricopeptide repeat protein [Thermoguttaceae bacterium]